jgi:subtilase family serine protease
MVTAAVRTSLISGETPWYNHRYPLRIKTVDPARPGLKRPVRANIYGRSEPSEPAKKDEYKLIGDEYEFMVSLMPMRSKSSPFLNGFAAYALCFMAVPRLSAQSAIKDRLMRPIESAPVSVLRGNVHALARPEFDQGPVEGSFRLDHITLMFKPSDSQQAALDALLGQLQDPSSPNYHRWLTPEQFADRFGLSPNDLAKITSWLQAQGFTIDRTARSRLWVVFSGTAQQVESAFHTPIHRYVINGETHYANAAEPSVPSALAGMVLGFRSLNNFRPRPKSVFRRVEGGMRPDFTSNISGNHFLAPDDFATIYDVKGLYSAGIDGTGQKIAVMGQTDITVSDITAFRAASGLPAKNPTVILIPGPDPGISKDDIGEADLDIEWAGGVAKNATIIYVNSGTASGAFDSLQYAIDNNLAPVMSISYGDCEQDMGSAALDSLSALGQQANSQGITILGPGGDNGATDCDFSTASTTVDIATHGLAVDAPASIPSFTGVGGSEFNEGSGSYWNTVNNSSNGSALSYIPEMVWNTTVQDKELAAGGGGKSIHFAKPVWQKGDGVPNDGARDVPDISLNASADHDGYLTCSQGSCVTGFRAADSTLTVVGGTSAGVPTFAGILALINEKTNSTQGNINFILYPLAASSPAAFHDITTGDNKEPCKLGSTDCPNGGDLGYTAGPGYDLASGLGSVDAFNLAAAWTTVSPPQGNGPDFQLSISPASLTVTRGGSGNATLSVSAVNGFTGAINLTCSVPSTLTGTTCSVSPGSIAGGGTASLTVMAATQSASLLFPVGSGPWGGWWQIGLGLIVALLLPGLLSRRIARPLHPAAVPRTKWAVLLGLTLVCLVAASVSCGGGSSSGNANTSPPVAHTATVTVQAVSGSLTHSVKISVTVN